MTQLMKSIIIGIFGLIILIAAILVKADVAVIVIGALFALVPVIYAIIDLKDKNKKS